VLKTIKKVLFQVLPLLYLYYRYFIYIVATIGLCKMIKEGYR